MTIEREGCGNVDENPLNEVVGDCSTATPTVTSSCPADDGLCVPTESCELWELIENPETCIIAGYIDESLNIGGAQINVYKMLGVFEQGSLDDLTGHGAPISGGSHPSFPANNAFDKYITEWKSLQTGTDVPLSAFIGYDFGPIRLNTGRLQYGVETFLKKEVSTIKIKQGCFAVNRATKVRIERSPDGIKWFGVAVVALPDCDALTTVHFKRSVASRYWRVRPVTFNGTQSDYWAVQALQLMDYEATDISNIQDPIFLENRDREYSMVSIKMKASYQPQDIVANQEKYGFVGSESYILETSFMQTLAKLGRPFVVGDIIELPSEKQYNPSLRGILKYVEVQDVAWSVNGYTPTWVPTMQRLICKPALASQETQSIYGKLTADIDTSGLSDLNDGNHPMYQDITAISQSIEAEANTMSPADLNDRANIPVLSDELITAGKAKGIKVEKFANRNGTFMPVDAMPPNGLPYTEGDAFPTAPKDKAYHRLTYSKVGKVLPARLYRYSLAKQQWIYLETDRRVMLRNDKSLLEEFKSSTDATPTHNIDKKLQEGL